MYSENMTHFGMSLLYLHAYGKIVSVLMIILS